MTWFPASALLFVDVDAFQSFLYEAAARNTIHCASQNTNRNLKRLRLKRCVDAQQFVFHQCLVMFRGVDEKTLYRTNV